MRYLIPIAIGILTGVIAFFFFSGLLAFPIKTINSYVIVKLLSLKISNASSSQEYPVAFTLKNDQPYRVIFSTQEQNDMKVHEYWYVWDHDASQKRDDPEPVFVYYKGLFGSSSNTTNGPETVFAIAHRIHYRWTVKYDGIITQGSRPVITFLTASHTPENNYPIQPKSYEPVKLTPKHENSIPYQFEDPWRMVDMTRSIEHSLFYASLAGGGAFIISAAIARSRR